MARPPIFEGPISRLNLEIPTDLVLAAKGKGKMEGCESLTDLLCRLMVDYAANSERTVANTRRHLPQPEPVSPN